MKYEVPSWDYIYELCIRVADRIKRSGYNPDLLVAIARGGWVPGRVLSDLLLNPNVATIVVEYYTDIYKTRKKPEITQPLSADVKGKRILLIDDVADSGKSIELVKKYLEGRGALDVKVCTLYHKPWSVVTPDYCARKTKAWVCFPHETYETMKKIILRLKAKGSSRKEIEAEFIRIGMKSPLVRKFVPQILHELRLNETH